MGKLLQYGFYREHDASTVVVSDCVKPVAPLFIFFFAYEHCNVAFNCGELT